MKTLCIALLLFIEALSHQAAVAAHERTLNNNRYIPAQSLRRMFSNKIYRDLAQQPIKAWIIVRADLRQNRTTGGTITKSEHNGIYDKAALQLAQGMEIFGYTTGTNLGSKVLVHVLVYDTREGEMALCLAQDDNSSGGNTNWIYSESVRIRFLGVKK